jgi:outer membrane protein OmpA-like peptidoglycan-associated protein/LysM repeat protein
MFLSINGQMGNFTDPVKFSIGINSEAEETSPIFSKDSTTLYFTRVFDINNKGGINDQDIWFSKKINGEFKNSENLKKLNNKLNNSVVGISKDGNSIYLLDTYKGKKNKIKGVVLSKLIDGKYSKPIHLDIPGIKNDSSFFGFHINEAENTIILSMKGDGSLGEEDLYVSTKNNEQWSLPVHLGNVINTSGFEISPFLSKKMDTLFFSSNGLGGEGDADIFYSIRKDNSWTEWSKPINLGSKINSPKYDAFFSYSSNQVYFVSNKEGDKSDIYSAKILPPAPIKEDMFINLSDVYGEIDLLLEGPDSPYTIVWETGELTEDRHNLSPGEYKAIITAKYGQTIPVSFTIGEPPIVVVEEVKKVNSEFSTETFNLLIKYINSIYFDASKYDISRVASKELDKIVTIMNDNPTLEIELGAHTDCQSNDESNLVLSHNRAKATSEYIKTRITKPERINGKGYGESQLKINCDCGDDGNIKSKCSKKENQLNRRIEFKMKNENSELTVDIATLPYQTFNFESKKKTTEENTDKSSRLIEQNTKNEDINKVKSKFRIDIGVSPEQAENIINGFYILQEGETLYRAAINSKVPISQLRIINKLKSNNVYPGTKLLLH